jgi:hypothetical protein
LNSWINSGNQFSAKALCVVVVRVGFVTKQF